MRVQLQKIQDACGKIRRNALNYSVRDYETILLENLDTIQDTKQKFQNYREMVKSRARELEAGGWGSLSLSASFHGDPFTHQAFIQCVQSPPVFTRLGGGQRDDGRSQLIILQTCV